MDLALTAGRLARALPAPAVVATGGLLGAVAWAGVPAALPLAFLFPALWALAPNRAVAGLVAFAYYAAAAARGVPAGAAVFFESGWAPAIALWLGASVVLALPWFVLFGERRRPLRAAGAMLLVAVPPIGIVGWAHPLTGIGELLPGSAWVGLGAGFAGLALSARWPVVGLVMASATFVVPKTPVEAPQGWQGITTHWLMRSGAHELGDQHQRLQALAQQVRANETDRVLIFPETILGTWLGPSQWLWAETAQVARRRGQTLVFGAEWPVAGGYENVAGVMTADGSLVPVYRQLMPVPFSMWRPGAAGGAVPAWFRPQAVAIDGRQAAFLICYEQLLAWPPLVAMSTEPEVLVGMANDWWARATNIPAIQRMTMAAWARLFGTKLVLSENL